METILLLQPILHITFAIILIMAGLYDARKYIIPNIFPSLLVVFFAITVFLTPEKATLASHVGSGALIFLVGMGLFKLGMFGGGDVKLWAAAALWFGLEHLHLQVMFVALSGGLLGLGLFAIRLVLTRERVAAIVGLDASLPRLLRVGEAVPYGVAIAIGSLLASKYVVFFQGTTF